MRFVWAVVAFVLATVMIGAGIAQRTMQGPRTETSTIEVPVDVPYVLVDGEVLNQHDGAQTFRAQREGAIYAAYARTTDLEAWLARSDYLHVTLDADGEIVSEAVSPEPVATDGESEENADAAEAPPAPTSPAGSDLWLDEFQQDDVLVTSLQLPEDASLLIAADGTEPAPSDLSLTWPTGAKTPWSGPLIVGGIIMLVVGLVLYGLGLRRLRRSRGPRRKGLPGGQGGTGQESEDDLSIEAGDKGVITAGEKKGRLTQRRAILALPAIFAMVAVTGCSADAWPEFGSTLTPTPTETVIAPEDQQQPAVTQTQAERIVAEIADTVAEADQALDPDLAAERLTGPALAARETAYRLRDAVDADTPGLPVLKAIPAANVEIVLPEARDAWPRTFLAVIEDPDTKAATMLTAVQADPWSEYKVTYIADLGGDTQLPDVAPSYVGANSVPPDSPFLVLPPDQLATAYADVIDKGADSEYAELFAEDGDLLRAFVQANRTQQQELFNETGEETGVMEFSTAAGTEAPVSFTTVDSGAIIAVTIQESETVTSTNDEAVIKLTENPIGQELTGKEESPRGFETNYLDQVFFFVPGQVQGGAIQFLGYSSDILSASELDAPEEDEE